MAIAKALASRRGARDPRALAGRRAVEPAARRRDPDGRARRAQTKLERAKLICGQRVSGRIERVRLGGSGQAIVEEAKAISAAAIVMPLRYRDGAPLYGKTLQTVLARRPCRVIVAANPGEQGSIAPSVRGAGGNGGGR